MTPYCSASIGRGTQDSMIVAGAANILKQVVARAGVRLAEPVMRVEVTTEQGLVGTVLQDLGTRRGTVIGTAGMDEVSRAREVTTRDRDELAMSELRGDGRGPPGGAGRLQRGAAHGDARPGGHQHAAQPLPADGAAPPGPGRAGGHGLLVTITTVMERCECDSCDKEIYLLDMITVSPACPAPGPAAC